MHLMGGNGRSKVVVVGMGGRGGRGSTGMSGSTGFEIGRDSRVVVGKIRLRIGVVVGVTTVVLSGIVVDCVGKFGTMSTFA